MKRKEVLSAIENRLEALISQSAGVPPKEIIQLLIRADRNRNFDLKQEISKLKNQQSADKTVD